MIRNRILLILTISTGVVAGALALGCGDRTGVTDPAPGTAPSFGAAVDHFEAPWPEIFVDPETGLTLLAGATFDLQQLFDILCVGQDFTEVADWLAVTHPTSGGSTVTHVRIKDQDQSVIVWGAASQDICNELVIPEVPPLAVGTARMMFTDNDFAGTSSHTDSFGQRIEGTVTNPATGQRYHLQAAYRVVVLPDGTQKVPTHPFVQLTPIGG
jgi:hypothetical protein